MSYLLCIDPGSHLGYSLFQGEALYEFGVIDGGEHVDRYDKINYMEDQVRSLFSGRRPYKLVIENIGPLRQMNQDANFWLNYTFGFAVSIANRSEMEIELVNPSTLKARVRTSGLLTEDEIIKYTTKMKKTGEVKKCALKKTAIVLAVNRMFHLSLKTTQDDVADAIAFGALSLGRI